jgi:hypothetical protein
VINSYGFQSLGHLFLHPIANINVLPTNKIISFCFFSSFFAFFFPSCKTSVVTNHSSSYAFNSIDDKHREKVLTHTTYSWDIENTHDLINS